MDKDRLMEAVAVVQESLKTSDFEMKETLDQLLDEYFNELINK